MFSFALSHCFIETCIWKFNQCVQCVHFSYQSTVTNFFAKYQLLLWVQCCFDGYCLLNTQFLSIQILQNVLIQHSRFVGATLCIFQNIGCHYINSPTHFTFFKKYYSWIIIGPMKLACLNRAQETEVAASKLTMGQALVNRTITQYTRCQTFGILQSHCRLSYYM